MECIGIILLDISAMVCMRVFDQGYMTFDGRVCNIIFGEMFAYQSQYKSMTFVELHLHSRSLFIFHL